MSGRIRSLAARLPLPAKRELVALAAIWLPVGFACGTLTLLGPVRWITSAMRDAGAGETLERVAVLSIIAAYVAGSFVLSLWMTRATLRQSGWARRAAMPALALGAAVACLWLWMSPDIVNGLQPVATETVAQFSFGPYPDEERLVELRAEGYTAVVSLLHPAVVPFEPTLIERERKAAEAAGIAFIHAPMLPWVSENQESLAKIRALAAASGGRYYVHCYLGRDRVGAVRSLVERLANAGALAAAPVHDVPYGTFQNTLFERGTVTEIDAGVYLAPYPTEEEFLSRVVDGSFQHVVSLLDPDNEDDAPWIDKEREIMAAYSVPFSLLPVSWQSYDPQVALAVARRVKTLPRPLLVHAFRVDGVAADALKLAYLTDLAPVSVGHFAEPMSAGTPAVLAPNVVVGPRPSGPEFGSYLYRRGIRAVAWIGAADTEASRHDRIVATREAGLYWRRFRPDDASLLPTLTAGGPWYVYGPALGAVQSRLDAGLRSPDEYLTAARNAAAAAAGMD